MKNLAASGNKKILVKAELATLSTKYKTVNLFEIYTN